MMLSDPVEIFLPTTTHFLVVLVVVTVIAFRSAASSMMRRLRFLWLLVLVWGCVAASPKISNFALTDLEGPLTQNEALQIRRDESTVIIVLSSGEMRTPGGRTRIRHDEMGWERIHGGVHLWRQTGGLMYFTGGPPGDPSQSIANSSRRIAQDMGVPASATALSSEAWNTAQELKTLQAKLAGHQGPVYLVTSAIHMRRAVAIADSLGLRVQPYPVGFRQIEHHSWRTWVPSNGSLERATAVLHEWVGLWVYRIKRSS